MKIRIDKQQYDLKSVDFLQWKKQWNQFSWKLTIINFLERFADDSKSIQLQTSGSTGTPKLIDAKKEYLLNSAKATCIFFNLSEKSTGLLCMNAQYIGAQMMLVRAIVSGMNLIVTEPKANPIANLETTIDFAAMVPYQVENVLVSKQKFQRIRNLIIGGGQIPKTLQQKLQQTSVNCYETFGMTETFSHIALRQVAPVVKENFTCLPNITVARTVQHQLEIHAPFLGIDKLITNDIIAWIDEKHFIWQGRSDNIINSGGIKIHPETIENQIKAFIDNDFIMIGLPHSELGTQLAMVIEGKPGNSQLFSEILIEHLSKFHIPKQILYMDEFPRTATQKIIRHKIQAFFTQKNHL